MSQLLFVQSAEGDNCSELYRRGLAACESFFHVHPIDQLVRPYEAIAIFPHLKAHTTGLVREQDKWICGVDAWFFHRVAKERPCGD
jgi:hypothetical protein